MKKTIAVCINNKFGFYSVLEIEDLKRKCFSEYSQVTEAIEVDFKERSESEIIADKIKATDSEIENVKEKFSKELSGLNQTKQELLALTFSPTSNG